MHGVLVSLMLLGGIGLLVSVMLYYVSQRFKVEENPLIDDIEALLPGANCGGCGYAGCRTFAVQCVKNNSLDGLFCSVGGDKVMKMIGDKIGCSVTSASVRVATVRCNGTCEARQQTSEYDGVRSCKIIHALYVGESDCPFGCLGEGDCVDACQFGAITIDVITKLPVVKEELCVACGKCVVVCPRKIIELRDKKEEGRMVVACVNKDKGAIARKACINACIGCGKCTKECESGAIKVEDNVAYIDYKQCTVCRKCENVCPTGAIHALDMPNRNVKEEIMLNVQVGLQDAQKG